MDAFLGTFELDLSKDVNIAAFCQKRGLPPAAENMMKQPGTTRIFSKGANGGYVAEMKHPMHSAKHEFQMGKPFEAELPMGKRTVVFNMEGSTLVEKFTDPAKQEEQIMRMTIEGKNLVVTMSCGDVTAKRVFVKK